MRFPDLETPCLLVEQSRLERNLSRMAEHARTCSVDLRPHWKTHKSPDLARRQCELGAVGGTVAKGSEADVFLRAGFEDLVIATPVVDPRRIAHLLTSRGGARLAVLVESEEGRARWSRAAATCDRPVEVLLEVDVGMGRTGVAPGAAALPLARAISESPGLELRGVLTHAGHGYSASSAEELETIGRAEGELLVDTARELRAAGLACPVVSVGSTPTVALSSKVPGVTEVRPGNYVFLDGIQVDLGVATPDDCALTVLATVLARPAPDRVVLDCGSKTLSSDAGRAGAAQTGLGRFQDRPELRIARLSEEHAIVPVPASAPYQVGDRVRVLPNHACATVNLHERLVIVDGSRVVQEWPIQARGCVT